MRDEQAIETEATELLRTLIRNKCVNDGTVASGQETRSVSALEDYFAGAGVACERYTSEPGRESLIARIEGTDPKAPRLLLMGQGPLLGRGLSMKRRPLMSRGPLTGRPSRPR